MRLFAAIIFLSYVAVGDADIWYNGCWITPVNGHVTWDLQNNGASIPDRAFRRCTDLETITIPEGVTSIGIQAFDRTSLTSIVIPSSVKRLFIGTFGYCTSLESVVLPEGLEAIGGFPEGYDDVPSKGGYVFLGCTSLTSLDIPDSVTFLASDLFVNSAIKSIVIRGFTSWTESYGITDWEHPDYNPSWNPLGMSNIETLILPNVEEVDFKLWQNFNPPQFRLFLPKATSVTFQDNDDYENPFFSWCPHDDGTQCTFNKDPDVPLDGRINSIQDVPQSILTPTKLKELYLSQVGCVARL